MSANTHPTAPEPNRAVQGSTSGDPTRIVALLVDEVINGGNTRLLGDLLDPEHVTHDPTGDLYGPEGMRIDIAGYGEIESLIFRDPDGVMLELVVLPPTPAPRAAGAADRTR